VQRRNQVKRSGNGKHVGLARALSKMGYCSRSRAAKLIRGGHVRLNGAISRDQEAPVRLGSDRVDVHGAAVAFAQKIYLMLNKPRGLVTTASDEKGRGTVYECLDHGPPWLGPVGRLDKASEGLLLMTNDTAWAGRITAPETHLDKTYHVQVNTVVDEAVLDAMRRDVKVGRGGELRAKRVDVLRRGERNSWLVVTLDEGRNRHIRRMLDALGLDVLRLVRVSIGPLVLGDLAKGAYRALTAEEKKAMDAAMRLSSARGQGMERAS